MMMVALLTLVCVAGLLGVAAQVVEPIVDGRPAERGRPPGLDQAASSAENAFSDGPGSPVLGEVASSRGR